MSETPTVFLDTETDGTHEGRRPWEVAMIRREGATEKRTSFFVELNTDTSDHRGLQIGGYYDRHPMGRYLADSVGGDVPVVDETVHVASHSGHVRSHSTGYLSADVAALVVARFTHGAQIWGAVPSFDTDTLGDLLRWHNVTPAWKHRVRCVETLTAGHFGREVGGLADCAEALGLEFDAADLHTAMGDAVLAMRIHDAIIKPAIAA